MCVVPMVILLFYYFIVVCSLHLLYLARLLLNTMSSACNESLQHEVVVSALTGKTGTLGPDTVSRISVSY
jgi:hypothetical protein